MAWGMSGRVQLMSPSAVYSWVVALARQSVEDCCKNLADASPLAVPPQGYMQAHPRSAKIWMRSEMHGKAPVCQHKLPRSNHHSPALQPSAEDLLTRRRRPEALCTAITIVLLAPKGPVLGAAGAAWAKRAKQRPQPTAWLALA